MINLFRNDDSGLQFYCRPDLYDVIPKPQVASKTVPEWFKKIKPLTDERQKNGAFSMSAKKCLPMLDAMSLGYTISLAYDVYIVTNHDLSIIEAKPLDQNHMSALSKHSHKQFYTMSFPGMKQDAIKWDNHWHIKTNPGWSCYFTSPINHLDTRFECLSGVVDTDKYKGLINFPCIWKATNFEGMIKAGTPLVQVIPFRRKDFKDTDVISRAATEEEMKQFDQTISIQRTREHYYTHELREKR